MSCVTHCLPSSCLGRTVEVDVYCPGNTGVTGAHLLLVNDGQDLHQFHFRQRLESMVASNKMLPLVAVGIHAGSQRIQEYGIVGTPDYAGRGAAAGAYQAFVLQELLPFLHLHLGEPQFASYAFAGFSLGGLSAFDIVWHNPALFCMAGVFSGSFWWRSHPLGEGYSDDRHRIMHQMVRKGHHHAGQRFYFTTGSLDETADRNGNGIIDSIDDTTDLVAELRNKGYEGEAILQYVNHEDGRHDVATWGRVMPAFLAWGWPVAD